MNQPYVAVTPEPEDAALERALIRCCALDDDSVARITQVAEMLGLGFCDAALRSGIVTEQDVEYARQSIRQLRLVQSERARPGPNLLLARDHFDPRSEKLLALRTELLLRHDSVAQANMIALVGPTAGDGRSQLAAELALAFAQLGHPTLLVDADLRKPQLHKLFNADNDDGLSRAILRREAPRLQTVENMPHMSLLTAGPIPSNPLELLSAEHFARMVREWRQTYAFVIFDTAPVSRYSDGLAVATLVQRVLLVNRASHTSYKLQREMLRRLMVTRSQIVGSVLSHF